MTEQRHSLKLSRAQTKYLETLEALAGLPAGLELNELALVGPRAAIESLRDQLTDILAERGFGEEYAATAEGELIESLIDTVYLP
jgi:hypothetical protein